MSLLHSQAQYFSDLIGLCDQAFRWIPKHEYHSMATDGHAIATLSAM